MNFPGEKFGSLKDYLIATTAILLASGICFPMAQQIGYQAVGLIFLMIVSILSLFLGRGALLYAAVLNFATWNFFFIPPLFTFRVHSIHDIISLFANLLVALVGSALISRIRKSQVTLKASRERLAILYSLLESLNNAVSIKDVVKRSQDGLKKYFDAEAVIFLKEKKGQDLSVRIFGNEAIFREEDFSRIREMFINSVGFRENSRSMLISGIEYFLLTDPRGAMGVVGISFLKGELKDPEQRQMLESFIVQIASAIEREIIIDLAKEQEFYHQSEKLFQTVLNSISHELRTPVSIITSAASNLNDEKISSIPENRQLICDELIQASGRLNLLVENFLDMTRIESGHLKLNIQFCEPGDLIGLVVKDLKKELQQHPVKINIEENLPMIRADIRFLRQALMNIIHNATVYTPPGSAIEISAYQEEKKVCLVIADHGKGIDEKSLGQIFNKFYRVPGTRSGGTGLGLTIAKAIVEAHLGTITAENSPDGGLKIAMVFNTGEFHGEYIE